MKLRYAFGLVLLWSLALLMGGVARSHAQAAPGSATPVLGLASPIHFGPMPPAYAVGLRCYGEAYAAQQYAARLRQVGNTGDAAYQEGIAHNRAVSAIRKFSQVAASATYRRTPYAADALYQQAQLSEKVLHNTANAIQSYQTLHNNFQTVAYPNMDVAKREQLRVEVEQDRLNQTPQPGFLGQLGPYLYKTLDFLVHLTGAKSYSYFFAILLISLLVKLALTPLSNAQYASMKAMQTLQPKVKALQEKFKGDKEAQGRKVMELYKEHGVNPAAGCLPLLVQLPILYGLYYMIRLYQYQFQKGDFLWIGSGLSHQFPSFLGINLGQPDIPILLLYALSMYIQQRMIVSPDPQQAEQQRTMAILTPFMTTYFFLQYHLPSAFVLYYLIFNILSTAQQQYYMKKRTAGDADGGDGGSRLLSAPPDVPGGGRVKALPRSGNGTGGAAPRRLSPGRDAAAVEASAEGTGANGSTPRRSNGSGALPTARGVIAPVKVHPKKKRR